MLISVLHPVFDVSVALWWPGHWWTWGLLGWVLGAFLLLRGHRSNSNVGKQQTLDEGSPEGCSAWMVLGYCYLGLGLALVGFIFDQWLWPAFALVALGIVISALTPSAK
ncbi:MAG: hypothetical protein ACAI34_22140 [Verrucomicrobium sp.]